MQLFMAAVWVMESVILGITNMLLREFTWDVDAIAVDCADVNLLRTGITSCTRYFPYNALVCLARYVAIVMLAFFSCATAAFVITYVL